MTYIDRAIEDILKSSVFANWCTYEFEWLSFSRLKDEYFYPLFIKEEIYNLPAEFRIRNEIE